MGILKSILPLTGSVGELTFYKVAGSDEIRVRQKGGPSAKQIKNDPRFDKTLRHSDEFAGRVRGAQFIMHALRPLHNVKNYNVTLSLHKPLKALQTRDTSHDLGERWISFSHHPTILEGISLNNANSLESIIPAAISCEINATGEARVQIPELIPGLTLNLSRAYPYFRIRAALAMVPDLHMTGRKYKSAVPGLNFSKYLDDTTPWLSTASSSGPHTFHLVPGFVPAGSNFVWMLSLGIELGLPTTPPDIQSVAKEGAAKVLRVVSGKPVHELSFDSPSEVIR